MLVGRSSLAYSDLDGGSNSQGKLSYLECIDRPIVLWGSPMNQQLRYLGMQPHRKQQYGQSVATLILNMRLSFTPMLLPQNNDRTDDPTFECIGRSTVQLWQ